MNVQDIYMKNYDFFSRKDSNTLLKYYFETNNTYLKVIAKNVLIETGIMDYNVNIDLLSLFVDTLSITDLWELAKSNNPIVKRVAEDKVFDIMDKIEIENNSNNIKLVK